MRIRELAERLDASFEGPDDLEIGGVATIEEAGPGDLTFLANERYAERLRTSRAAAVLVAPTFAGDVPPRPLRVENPYLAFARAIRLFHAPPAPPPGVHPTAVLGEDVVLEEGVSVGPYVVIGDRARIGRGAVLRAHVVVHEDAVVGPDCLLRSHVVVREGVRLGRGVIVQDGAVLGADGFGFAPRGDGSWEKIPQVGTVEIGDDVEVQALACVDRAGVGRTTVGRGTKIDNLVQVGHGCRIGEDVLLCGQVGLAGSTEIGSRVTLAGQVGVGGHCRIADDVTVGAQAGVHNSLEEKGAYVGSPAVDLAHFKRIAFWWARLPEVGKRLRDLERRMEAREGERPPGA